MTYTGGNILYHVLVIYGNTNKSHYKIIKHIYACICERDSSGKNRTKELPPTRTQDVHNATPPNINE